MKLFLFVLFLAMPFVSQSEPLNCINSRHIIYRAYSQHYSQPDIDSKTIENVVDMFIKREDNFNILLTTQDILDIKNDLKKNKKRYAKQFLNQFEYGAYTQSYFFNAESYNQTGCEFINLSIKKIDDALDLYTEQFNKLKKLQKPEYEKAIDPEKTQKYTSYSKRAKSKKELIKRMNELLEYRISVNGLKAFEKLFNLRMDKSVSRKYSNLINSFLQIQDAHSSYSDQVYLDDKDNENMSDSLDPVKKGYGVVFYKKDTVSEYPTVLKVLRNSVLEQTGKIFKNDLIINIDGTDLKDLTTKEISDLLTGKNSSDITFRTFFDKVEFPEFYEDIKLSLTKGTFESEFIHSDIIQKNNKTFLYIKLDSFYYSYKTETGSAYDLRQIYLETVESKKIKIDGVILDLRDNYGGHVGEATQLAHLFLGSKLILRYIDNKMNEYPDYARPLINGSFINPLITEPLILLVNRNSASASEILAGAIQDYKRGLIVGDDHTFGKGSMQIIYPDFEYLKLGELKVTTNLFYLASGKTPQHSGILSDIVIPSPTRFREVGEKFMEHSLNPKKPLLNLVEDSFDSFDQDLLKTLKDHSKKRVTSDKVFDNFKTVKSVDKYLTNLNQNFDILSDKKEDDPILNESVCIFEEYSSLLKSRDELNKKRELLSNDHIGQ